jgi:NADPH-dependent 2,4-dienoyl-CoA reductase/sulfur reductase-like enzyme/peroxiredoxin family protein/TusA-related sulfurtransferase/rhodanese-related sulfurtransferase
MTRVLIVGGVAGGMSAVARLRRRDEKAEIIVFEKGEYVSFANCGLPYHIGNVIQDREKLLLQTPQSFLSRFNVQVKIQHEVVTIDPKAKRVTVRNIASGKETAEEYDKLILSPGAEPIRPPLPGIDHPCVFTLRNIPDTDRLKNFVDRNHPRRALIIGAGFIGLEMAENLQSRGVFVTIVEMANQVMNAVDFELAAVVHQHLRQKKVEFYLEDAAASFADENGRVKVTLKSGREITVDMVLLSIGVRPDTRLAKEAGLELGGRGGIKVDSRMQTSDPDIYAVGDAVETLNPITGKYGVTPLAGPANKQGRIVADNIADGNKHEFKGSIGTAIAKVFDLTVATTGATEKLLKAEKIPYLSAIIHPASHAGYYPNALQMTIKITFAPDTGRLYGAQAVGYDGVDKRIDVLALAVQHGLSIRDLEEFEHTYAPPFSSAKDPVNMIGFVAENLLDGQVHGITWDELDASDSKDMLLLDVRTPEEVHTGTIRGAVNIPVDDLRNRLREVPRDKRVAIFCRVGLRGYIAARILAQNGYNPDNLFNLSGGYLTYSAVHQQQDYHPEADESLETGMKNPSASVHLNIDVPGKSVELDATGLQCPGPIMKMKDAMEKLNDGDKLVVKATDPGFANDVEAWTRATKNTLLSVNTEKGIIRAVVEKHLSKDLPAGDTSSGNDKTLIVFDNDLDKLIASFIIANGALSMGRKVTMFFTFWGTSALRKSRTPTGLKKNLIEKMFGFMLPKGSRKLKLSQMNMGGMGAWMIRGLMKTKKVPSLEEMIQMGIAGGIKIVACQMSMDLMGIRAEELIDGVTVGGVASYLEASEHADNNLFI